MPSRREELEQILQQARTELTEILKAEESPIQQALLGRYFKYRNCYSCSQTDADSWWLYLKPLTILDGRLFGISFQQDTNGEISIQTAASLHYLVFRDGVPSSYIEIPTEEFWGAWAALQVQIQQAAERAGRPLG